MAVRVLMHKEDPSSEAQELVLMLMEDQLEGQGVAVHLWMRMVDRLVEQDQVDQDWTRTEDLSPVQELVEQV